MLIFHDFPWPLLFSTTFQAWKMVFINSRTFHDFPGPVVTLLIKISTQSGCTARTQKLTNTSCNNKFYTNIERTRFLFGQFLVSKLQISMETADKNGTPKKFFPANQWRLLKQDFYRLHALPDSQRTMGNFTMWLNFRWANSLSECSV